MQLFYFGIEITCGLNFRKNCTTTNRFSFAGHCFHVSPLAGTTRRGFRQKEFTYVVYYHNTPASFAALLHKAKQYADSHREQHKLITINARDEWEWVEGSYLLPDMLNGYGYLNTVKKVMSGGFDE